MTLLLVTLSGQKDHTDVVTSLKTLGDQRIKWNYTIMRLLDEYAQLNRPTASEEVDRSSKAENDTGYLASSSIGRTSSASLNALNTSTSKIKCFNCDRIGIMLVIVVRLYVRAVGDKHVCHIGTIRQARL